MTAVAFDSSALMAILLEESGSERAAGYLTEGRASAAIWGETLSKMGLRGRAPAWAADHLKHAGLVIDPLTEEDAVTTASLYTLARRGVSLADRFCLAHAMIRKLPVITSDRPWSELDLPIELIFIR
ncbi:MAG: PIN domain-containing protein [Caulobacteraceae bacterium]|nr:PIN domain-containing protein [Caulobacteraceae bacterium]